MGGYLVGMGSVARLVKKLFRVYTALYNSVYSHFSDSNVDSDNGGVLY